jgi:hypothetical protein
VGALNEGLRDSDEHATKNGVMHALRNKRLFIPRTLLQGRNIEAHKKNGSRGSRKSGSLEHLKN